MVALHTVANRCLRNLPIYEKLMVESTLLYIIRRCHSISFVIESFFFFFKIISHIKFHYIQDLKSLIERDFLSIQHHKVYSDPLKRIILFEAF